MQTWDKFLRNRIECLFANKRTVIDIGGGLRIRRDRGSRYDPDRNWAELLAEKTDYKILDPVSTFKPDIVGDIHALPFEDNSEEAIICMSVLEHVEDPRKAVGELYRVLKPGGQCFVYVPFLFYYHSEEGYYKDYWRFTHDTIALLFKNFSTIEVEPVRGPLATWLHISPLGRIKPLVILFNLLDKIFDKTSSHQVSGYYVFLTK